MTITGARFGRCRASCAFWVGAGDGNRTRTVSLGICTVRGYTLPDLRTGASASTRDRPLVAGVNGPLMAQAIVVLVLVSLYLRERALLPEGFILSPSATLRVAGLAPRVKVEHPTG
jgi:hypothetical protein